MKLDRRNFLTFMAGAAGGFLLTPVNWKLMDDVAIWTQNWSWVPVVKDGARAFTNAGCMICGGGCGIKVRLIDGQRAVKIEGNPDNPLNRGGLCAWGAAGLQYLYLQENRVPGPMRRDRKTGVWTRLSWEEAVQGLAKALKEADPEEVALISGRKGSTVTSLLKGFMAAYGSPLYCEPADGRDVQRAAAEMVFGRPSRYGFDLERAKLVLSFNAALLEGWGSPVRCMRAFEVWRSGEPKEQTRLIQVDPRSSLTASKADEWLAAKPGTETVLALALANALIQAGLVSPEAQSSQGFEELKGFLAQWGPAKAEKITGVAKDKIEATAQAFGRTQEAVALSGQGHGGRPEPLDLAWAVLVLNLLKGNVGHPGGLFFTPDPPGLEIQGADGPAVDPLHLARETASGKKKLKALLLFEANPRFSGPEPQTFDRALDQVPLVVSFSSFWDETTLKSDLVLPDHTYLERWDDTETPLGLPFQSVSLAKPIFGPKYNTRATIEVIIELAKLVGRELPVGSAEEAIRLRVAALQQTGQGLAALEEPPAPEELLAAGPGPGFGSAEEAFEAVAGGGIWYQPGPGEAPGQPSFLSRPKVEPLAPEGDEHEYPLELAVFDSARVASGFYANPPFVTKILEDDFLLKKDVFVNLHPTTARDLHLAEGAAAVLETEVGQGTVRVHLTQAARPGVVFLPAGLGHRAFDPTIKDKGVNAAVMVKPLEDPNGGRPLTFLARAKLRKA